MTDEWDEDRIDIIGTNGNEGLHYGENHLKIGSAVRVMIADGLEEYGVKQGLTSFINQYHAFPDVPNQPELASVYCDGKFLLIEASRLEEIDPEDVVDLPPEMKAQVFNEAAD